MRIPAKQVRYGFLSRNGIHPSGEQIDYVAIRAPEPVRCGAAKAFHAGAQNRTGCKAFVHCGRSEFRFMETRRPCTRHVSSKENFSSFADR